MKTTLVKFLVVAVVATVLFTSCSSHHRCEAYSSAHYKSSNTYASIK